MMQAPSTTFGRRDWTQITLSSCHQGPTWIQNRNTSTTSLSLFHPMFSFASLPPRERLITVILCKSTPSRLTWVSSGLPRGFESNLIIFRLPVSLKKKPHLTILQTGWNGPRKSSICLLISSHGWTSPWGRETSPISSHFTRAQCPDYLRHTMYVRGALRVTCVIRWCEILAAMAFNSGSTSRRSKKWEENKRTKAIEEVVSGYNFSTENASTTSMQIRNFRSVSLEFDGHLAKLSLSQVSFEHCCLAPLKARIRTLLSSDVCSL